MSDFIDFLWYLSLSLGLTAHSCLQDCCSLSGLTAVFCLLVGLTPSCPSAFHVEEYFLAGLWDYGVDAILCCLIVLNPSSSIYTQRQTHTHKERQRYADREIHTCGERHIDTHRDRETHRYTQRQRETDRQTQRERQIEKEGNKALSYTHLRAHET